MMKSKISKCDGCQLPIWCVWGHPVHLVPSPQQNYFSVEGKKKKKEKGEQARERERERRASGLHMSNASATIRETVYNYLFVCSSSRWKWWSVPSPHPHPFPIIGIAYCIKGKILWIKELMWWQPRSHWETNDMLWWRGCGSREREKYRVREIKNPFDFINEKLVCLILGVRFAPEGFWPSVEVSGSYPEGDQLRTDDIYPDLRIVKTVTRTCFKHH